MHNQATSDTASVRTVLADLRTKKAISTRTHNALLNGPRRGFRVPVTVGELRQLLQEERPWQLQDIPDLGPGGIAELRTLFLNNDQIRDEGEQ